METVHCRTIESEALVVVGGRSNVEAIVACGTQDVCDPGLLYTRALFPSGAIGVLLKSNYPRLPGWLTHWDFVRINTACFR